MTSQAILYDYPKSSASYRVRIALNLAQIPYQIHHVNLLEGAHKSPNHIARNPQGLVPVLEIDGTQLTQSLAIISYLNETHDLGLLPQEPIAKTRVTAAAMAIAVDLHPVCNLSVVKHATGGKDPARQEWMAHFIRPALTAFEAIISAPDFASSQGVFCAGDTPSLADICLIPQLYNARRWQVDYSDCKTICRVEAACAALDAFADAHPDRG